MCQVPDPNGLKGFESDNMIKSVSSSSSEVSILSKAYSTCHSTNDKQDVSGRRSIDEELSKIAAAVAFSFNIFKSVYIKSVSTDSFHFIV